MKQEREHSTVRALEGIDKSLQRIAASAEALVGINVTMAQFQLNQVKRDESDTVLPNTIVDTQTQIAEVLKKQKEALAKRREKTGG